ncbi:Penicillin-binding protein 1A [Candidatus Cyrtobacter comes]|uniref:peptidoglycan glycosyltransferase n=1 Tax=Candidatus Cyrtobacter comes TaxID=675776 RepID=A0ABU5L688_9RICK|nr:PBP1A family penicillin-binding protein [Candidatus Cyrtobacter comes]MDZ5761646.1 Penicillin-binding protein 1A [Candidatus Cyrtobacter comes]
MILKVLISVVDLLSRVTYYSLLLVAFFFISFLGSILIVRNELPNHEAILNYKPLRQARIYDNTANLVDSIGKENRVYVKYNDIPNHIISAFIAAEDKNFYSHIGIDIQSIIRATLQSTLASFSGKRLIGGSTITQQVVRIFLLNKERTLLRKVKEALLAIKISNILSKEKVMELYLNEIFLGQGSYGILAASTTYFQKKLKDITVSEAALLASLPKAPSSLNPFINSKRAKNRRDWILKKMLNDGFISEKEYKNSIETDLGIKTANKTLEINNLYYTEFVEKEARKLIGDELFERGGIAVNTYLDLKTQKAASEALRNGIENHSKKMGWYTPFSSLHSLNNWQNQLSLIKLPWHLSRLSIAVFLGKREGKALLGIKNGNIYDITSKPNNWIINHLKIGDVVLFSTSNDGEIILQQDPKLEGSVVALEPSSGKVLAMVGGYDYRKSSFNRAIQSKRQPGSVFKTFVYLAALDSGYEPNFLISDSPISVLSDGFSKAWSPNNYGKNYLGDITIRTAFEKSKNTATVRLALEIGVQNLAKYVEKFGFSVAENYSNYSIALGTLETSLIDITAAYNVFPSNGTMPTPRFIESIYDADGNLLYSDKFNIFKNYDMPFVYYQNKKIINEDVNFQMLSMLEDVVQRGTAIRAKRLGHGIAGKTGTTNNSFDAWFIGFSSDITIGVFVGFDQPETLGKKEGGYSIALPIFINLMEAMNYSSSTSKSFKMPPGITPIYINKTTGEPVSVPDIGADTNDLILEFFKSSNITPKRNRAGHHEVSTAWDIVQSIN